MPVCRGIFATVKITHCSSKITRNDRIVVLSNVVTVLLDVHPSTKQKKHIMEIF